MESHVAHAALHTASVHFRVTCLTCVSFIGHAFIPFAIVVLQVTSIQAVLANGTLANFSPHSNQHLWRAMQVCTDKIQWCPAIAVCYLHTQH